MACGLCIWAKPATTKPLIEVIMTPYIAVPLFYIFPLLFCWAIALLSYKVGEYWAFIIFAIVGVFPFFNVGATLTVVILFGLACIGEKLK